MTFFGSWTVASDLSGQPRRDNSSPVLVIAAIGVASEVLTTVRATVRENVPAKWRDGGLAGFRAVQSIIVSHKLPVAVTIVTGISAKPWHDFWDDGQRAATLLHAGSSEKAVFAQSEHTSRMFLFSMNFAHCAGQVLKRRGWKPSAPRPKRDSVHFNVVFDTDISNLETRELLAVSHQEWADWSNVMAWANIDPTIAVEYKTEQEEPLLMLADYVAGTFYHAHPEAVLNKPVAPVDEVRRAVATFKETVGPALRLESQVFQEKHPLRRLTDPRGPRELT